MNITVVEKQVSKGVCRCGCGTLATVLNAKYGKNEWYGIKAAQSPVNVHKAHMGRYAYGEALNTRTKNRGTSAHTHEIMAVVRIENGFTAQCIAIALRQGAWTVNRDGKNLVISADLDARQVGTIDTVKAAVKNRDTAIRWYHNGEEVSELELDEAIAKTDSRNLHGADSKAVRRCKDRKK